MTNFTSNQNQELSEKVKQAVEANAKHLRMSPETKIMIKNMQKQLAEAKEERSEAKTDRALMKKDVTYIKEKLDDFIDSANRKYATKEELELIKQEQSSIKDLLTWKLGVVVAVGVAVIYFLVDILKDKIL